MTTVKQNFSELTRVQIPALVHLSRLGYEYLSTKSPNYKTQQDPDTNILKNVFANSIRTINSDKNITDDEIATILTNIHLELGNKIDLGKSFYERLTGVRNNVRLIDFENPDNNTYNICAELTYGNKDKDNFRTDITVFINGLPLVYIEVKKPNNIKGMKAEKDRFEDIRLKNDAFLRYNNITQFVIFSNNMEYNDEDHNSLEGVYYTTPAKTGRDGKVRTFFNHFREERFNLDNLTNTIANLNDSIEQEILRDLNKITVRITPEYQTNLDSNSPTNRILTSMLSKERLLFLLKYGLTYVEKSDKEGNSLPIEKHIMRYPQLFATKAIEDTLNEGVTKGIIWHTQGSGKTALAYYNQRFLTDHFAKSGTNSRFYFIVDRLDLLNQAAREFRARGLYVNEIQNKDDLISDFQTDRIVTNNDGKPEITVVNIQKFSEDAKVISNSNYNTSIKRIFFIDEAHRGYKHDGTFLSNLYSADRNSVKIALTGTPLILHDNERADGKKKSVSREVFGDYIHKYYFNSSIRDGYTLRLISENIDQDFKDEIDTIKQLLHDEFGTIKDVDEKIRSHQSFVKPMVKYIVDDLLKSRVAFGDDSIGAMVICDSSDQARAMYDEFVNAHQKMSELNAALILHDEGTKDDIRKNTEAFVTNNGVDILFVRMMLQTGFDAPRLKKLYLGRRPKWHDLLQTLARVNRPYHNHKFGYIIDFEDISESFEKANQAYFEELNDNSLLPGAFGMTLVTPEEVRSIITNAQDILLDFQTDNLEVFRKQIDSIPASQKNQLLNISKALSSIRSIANILKRDNQYADFSNKFDFTLFNELDKIVSARIAFINFTDGGGDGGNELSDQALNLALENYFFNFAKEGEKELVFLANDTSDLTRQIREQLNISRQHNGSPNSETSKNLSACLRKYDYHNHEVRITTKVLEQERDELKTILDDIREQNRQDSLVLDKYNNDTKYFRTHKYYLSEFTNPTNELRKELYNALGQIKSEVDAIISTNEALLGNKEYFASEVKKICHKICVKVFDDKRYYEPLETRFQKLVDKLSREYIAENEGGNNAY